MNKLKDILNFDVCKKMVDNAKANGETGYVILCSNYSIFIHQKYEGTGEELMYDLDELSNHIGESVGVSDYDDLVVDLSSEN